MNDQVEYTVQRMATPNIDWTGVQILTRNDAVTNELTTARRERFIEDLKKGQRASVRKSRGVKPTVKYTVPAEVIDFAMTQRSVKVRGLLYTDMGSDAACPIYALMGHGGEIRKMFPVAVSAGCNYMGGIDLERSVSLWEALGEGYELIGFLAINVVVVGWRDSYGMMGRGWQVFGKDLLCVSYSSDGGFLVVEFNDRAGEFRKCAFNLGGYYGEVKKGRGRGSEGQEGEGSGSADEGYEAEHSRDGSGSAERRTRQRASDSAREARGGRVADRSTDGSRVPFSPWDQLLERSTRQPSAGVGHEGSGERRRDHAHHEGRGRTGLGQFSCDFNYDTFVVSHKKRV